MLHVNTRNLLGLTCGTCKQTASQPDIDKLQNLQVNLFDACDFQCKELQNLCVSAIFNAKWFVAIFKEALGLIYLVMSELTFEVTVAPACFPALLYASLCHPAALSLQRGQHSMQLCQELCIFLNTTTINLGQEIIILSFTIHASKNQESFRCTARSEFWTTCHCNLLENINPSLQWCSLMHLLN